MRAGRAPLVRTPEVRLIAPRRLAAALVVVATLAVTWSFVLGQATGPLPTPPVVLARSLAFLGDLMGASSDATPAFARLDHWRDVAVLVVDTLTMSILAMGIAGLGALGTVGPASRLLMSRGVGPGSQTVSRLVLVTARGTHAVLRAVPELIWAMLIVFVLRPGIVAGALALALHEIGVLGRLTSDVVDDLDEGPLRSLASAGAGTGQVVFFGALPQVAAPFVTFLLYRWEVVIRATVVVGFITGAGLGHQLRLSLSFRRWTEVATVLMAYVMMVWVVEAIAGRLRRLAD